MVPIRYMSAGRKIHIRKLFFVCGNVFCYIKKTSYVVSLHTMYHTNFKQSIDYSHFILYVFIYAHMLRV